MSDERKGLLKYFDDMCSSLDFHGWTQSYELVTAIRHIIQQKSEIDDMKKYVDGRAEKLYRKLYGHWNESSKYDGNFLRIRDFITQILKEVRGGGKLNEDWLPTAKNINALPEPLRDYIIGLEGNCDPPHLVQENMLLSDTCKQLEAKLKKQ